MTLVYSEKDIGVYAEMFLTGVKQELKVITVASRGQTKNLGGF